MMNTISDIVRALIRESVCQLRLEDAFADDILNNIVPHEEVDVERSVKDFINDIPELKNYKLIEHLPLSYNNEKWTFEAESIGSWLNTITIEREFKNGTSQWKFIFAQAEKSMEHMTAEVIYQTPPAEYEVMVGIANKDWKEWS